MDWQDEGLLLGVRRHGENAAIIEVLTAGHGRHAGLVHGGGSRKLGAVLQPGTQLSLAWRARLEDHLGTYQIEPVRSRAAAIMADPARLACLNATAALTLAMLPEREPVDALYGETIALVDALAEADPIWPARYAFWEFALLATLGFGLDLTRCAATGVRDDLIYVSPRTGRAVSRLAGGAWADRLLPLPGFLIGQGGLTMGAVRDSLRLSGHFLAHWAAPAMGIEALPGARERLLERLERHEMPPPPEPDPQADEREYHRATAGLDVPDIMLPG